MTIFWRRRKVAGRPWKITTGKRLSTRSYAPTIGRLKTYFKKTSETVTAPMTRSASMANTSWMFAIRRINLMLFSSAKAARDGGANDDHLTFGLTFYIPPEVREQAFRFFLARPQRRPATALASIS